ncbi:MAG: TIM-barrel domain-containing protein [Bacteroidota bacterium]
MKKWIRNILITAILILTIVYFYWILPVWGVPFNSQRHEKLPLTPSWVLENWLWEDDVNTSAYIDELLQGYKEHDIPVRTIILDSPWSLRYNDFEIDTIRYPQPEKWFKNLQDNDYRVVLWMTSLINSNSKDSRINDSEEWYNRIKEKGYLVKSKHLNHWWKGDGGFLDYSNPEAVKWWRSKQQKLFDYGIDGWKLDGAATLFYSKIAGLPFFYKDSKEGLMTTRKYMDLYYREEYKHGLTQNPEFVTLSRAIDGLYAHPEGFSPFDSSPVNWVGDQKHTWAELKDEKEREEDNVDLVMEGAEGITMAIEHVLASAKLGYNVIGSDIAGFSGSKIPPRLYIRWTQFSAFCGLFMNGGHGERRLWKRSKEELEIIRKFSWMHTELIPYMYHYVVSAHNGERRLQTVMNIGKYQYMFGDDFLVAPIYIDSKKRSVSLPEGEWRYFFNDIELLEGGLTFEREYPIDEFPVYIKEGAIVPMKISRAYTNIGDNESEGFTTLLIYPKDKNSFTYYHSNNSGETEISYRLKDKLFVSINGDKIAHILRIHSEKAVKNVILDGEKLDKKNWSYDSQNHKITIRTSNYTEGEYEIQY